jgi:hypothetical protein
MEAGYGAVVLIIQMYMVTCIVKLHLKQIQNKLLIIWK